MNNKAPEPDAHDILKAAESTAIEVFNGSDGKLTVAYYRRLCAIGKTGEIAMNLFRASKRSARAKAYRGRRFNTWVRLQVFECGDHFHIGRNGHVPDRHHRPD